MCGAGDMTRLENVRHLEAAFADGKADLYSSDLGISAAADFNNQVHTYSLAALYLPPGSGHTGFDSVFASLRVTEPTKLSVSQEGLNAHPHLGQDLAGLLTLRPGGHFVVKHYTFFEVRVGKPRARGVSSRSLQLETDCCMHPPSPKTCHSAEGLYDHECQCQQSLTGGKAGFII